MSTIIFTIKFFIFFLILFFVNSYAKNIDYEVICYSNNISFGLTTPKNWHLDSRTAKNYGQCMFYEEKNFSFDTSPSLIYIGNVQKQDMIDLEKYIMKDLEKFDAPKIIKINRGEIKNNDSMTFTLREIKNGQHPNKF